MNYCKQGKQSSKRSHVYCMSENDYTLTDAKQAKLNPEQKT